MLETLTSAGFAVYTTNHAQAILVNDFPDAVTEIEAVLAPLQIPVSELIEGGGGEGTTTQRLRHAFAEQGWRRRNIHIDTRVDGVDCVSDSHEVDHVKSFPHGQLLLEIEWNNKDPFYDRDLQNFKSLHGANAASLGIIVTRGASLQSDVGDLVADFLRSRGIDSYDRLGAAGYTKGTDPQRKRFKKLVEQGEDPVLALANVFVRDKYGTATTHWGKLMERLERGMGRPCPLLCIGIPSSVVHQH